MILARMASEAPAARREGRGLLHLPFTWRELGVAMACAMALRLVMLALVAYSTTDGDMVWYRWTADNILDHGVFSDATTPPYTPTIFRPPLYSALIALVWLVMGRSFFALQLVQCALGVVAVALLGSAVGTLSKRNGRWALWALALSPFDAVYGGAMLSEALVTFFLVAGISAPFLLRGRSRWAASGVLVGLAALTRDVYMLLIPVLALLAVVVIVRQPLKTRLVLGLLVALGGAVTIAPWTVRNVVVVHQVVPISRSSFAHSLYLGTWVRNTSHLVAGGDLGEPEDFPAYAWKLPGERELYTRWSWRKPNDEVARDRVYMQMFRSRLAGDPLGVALAYVRRAPYVWVGTTRFDLFAFRPSAMARGKPLYFAAKVTLFGLNIVGVLAGMFGIGICLWKHNWRLFWFGIPVVYTIGILAPLGVIEPRYTQPVYSCLLVMACLTARYASVAWRRARRRSRRGSRYLN